MWSSIWQVFFVEIYSHNLLTALWCENVIKPLVTAFRRGITLSVLLHEGMTKLEGKESFGTNLDLDPE